MAENKRHHFVPQFYLRNFATDTGRRRIALFNLKRDLFVPNTSIISQAQRSKLYGEDGREQALATIEGMAAAVLRKAVRERQLPKRFGMDHSTLLTFILFQAFRTPAAGAELEEFHEMLAKAIMSHDDRIAPHLDAIRISLKNPVVHTLRNAGLHIPLMEDLWFKLLINPTTIPFVSSDHPVILYNQFMERRSKFGSSTGLATKGLQMFLPLDPKTCLIFYDSFVYRVGGRSLKGVQVQVTVEDVRALNTMQAANAQLQLYFNRDASEREIRRTVASAAPHRFAARSQINSTAPRINADGTKSVFFHSSKKDLRMGLRLSPVNELPSARGYRLGTRVVHPRNPPLCALHGEFLRAVDRDGAMALQWQQFVKDRRDRSPGGIVWTAAGRIKIGPAPDERRKPGADAE